MGEVTVEREALLARIKENRAKHRDVFLKAIERYREAVIRELEASLAAAREGKRIRTSISLIEPMDHTREYDQVIDMLGMSVEKNITLSQREFSQYARDEWQWKEQFSNTANSYGISAE